LRSQHVPQLRGLLQSIELRLVLSLSLTLLLQVSQLANGITRGG